MTATGMNTLGDRIERANAEAVAKLKAARPVWFDVAPAREAVPGMHDRLILHAGPPIAWARMCGPVRGAVAGALVYERLAKTVEEAYELAASGAIEFSPNHHHGGVGPMAGVTSASMWVFRVRNEAHGNTAFCNLNEGLGRVLRFGANDAGVIERLRWMETELAPALREAVRLREGGIDVKTLIANALHMGDECHNRNVAGTSLLLRELTPLLLSCGVARDAVRRIFDFISGNNHFFLNLAMAAAKSMADSIMGMPFCTIQSAMARNGTEIGIRVAGLGDRWFTAPAGNPKGLYFPGFDESHANPDLGDSTITETAGFGGFAMAAGPAITRFVGGRAADAVRFTREMGEITAGRHTDFTIPALDFQGVPLGVDIRRVVETGITPFINTGIAHKDPGVGQVGAGLLRAPLEIYRAALDAFDADHAGEA